MNDREHLEAELRRLKPAAPPSDFMARLAAVAPQPGRADARAPQISVTHAWRQLLRWLMPVTVAFGALVLAIVWPTTKPAGNAAAPPKRLVPKPAAPPNDVQIDRQWVAAYDAVAQLPTGEPVRFRCQQWMDEVVLRDPVTGVQVEQRTPRVEIVAAKLDTY